MQRSFFAFVFAAMIFFAQQQSAQSSQRPQKVMKPAASRFQPFRYRMAYSEQGQYLAGFSKVHVSGDTSGTSGQSPRRESPTVNKNVNITLERGVVTQDPSFAQWLNRSRQPSQAKDLVIDTFNETGQKSSSMYLGRCVVAEYQSRPDLDGAANSAKIQVMTLHCASLKRSKR
jgi:phage tail-like protein